MTPTFFSRDTPVNFFLSSKSSIMLRILNKYSNIFSKFFLEKLAENKYTIKKSQFYNYIDTLKAYKLIEVGEWKKTADNFGRSYNITKQGIDVLDLMVKYFEEIL